MPDDLTPERLAELRALRAAYDAAAAEYHAIGNAGGDDDRAGRVADLAWHALGVAARNTLPALLDRVEALEAENARWREWASRACLVVDWAADLAAHEADPMPRWPLDNLVRLNNEGRALLADIDAATGGKETT